MTEDQALSLLRARSSGTANAEFVVVHEFEPDEATRSVAKEASNRAESEHRELYEAGVLVDMMRFGGFLVLETDAATDTTTALHLVTQNGAGKPVVESNPVQDKVSRADALILLDKSETIARAFLGSPSSNMTNVLREYVGEHLPASTSFQGEFYFDLPEDVAKLPASPEQLLDLISISGELEVWSVRSALSTQSFAANPEKALAVAHEQELILADKFLADQPGGLKFPDLMDLNSIKTVDGLVERANLLRELNSFLNERDPVRVNSSTYQANLRIAAIPLQLGFASSETTNWYGVMTASGLIFAWSRDGSGDIVLAGLAEAGD